MASLQYFPAVKPSAIALGIVFKTTTSLLVGTLIEGTIHYDEIKEELARDKPSNKNLHKVTDDVTHHSSTLTGSAFQTYAMAVLLSNSGTLSYKGAAYVGALVYFASSVPGLLHQVVQEKRSFHVAFVDVSSHLIETIGLSMFLTYWGVRPVTSVLERRY